MKGRDSMGYDGKLTFDTKIDESGFNKGVGKLGTLAKSGLAVLGSYVTSFVSVTSIAKDSINEVAKLEQNVGGIETLFGAGGAKTIEEYANSVGKAVSDVKEEYDMLMEAQTNALDNAKSAYKTAGLSANDYMSTVTSFAAALKQSVDNEVEAAKAADQAVVDMSDNANKMGTSMESIQNAYQGFAKQNYTMLDNLKLGYGGTKKEMERLLEDAEKLSDVKYDIDNLADVYAAIHVIQTELGITGTTAKEALTTIEGSMNSAKAAWSNFLAGTATSEDVAEALGIAADVMVNNLEEIVPRLADTIPKVAEKLAPTVVRAGSSLAKAGLSVLSDLISGIYEKAPEMIETGSEMLSGFLQGIGERLPELVPKALEMVVTLSDSIISNLPTIINAGIALLKGLLMGIIKSLPLLIANGPRIINDFADAIYSGVWELIKIGGELLFALIKGIWENVPLLLENAGEIFMAFINIFSLSNLYNLGKNIIKNLVNGIKNLGPSIVETGGNLVEFLVNGIKNLATHPVATLKNIASSAMKTIKSLDWKSIGSNIINGIVNGLKNGINSIISTAKDVAGAALSAAKKALGIKSPSRRFRDEVGKNMALGVGEGFEENMPVNDMTGALSDSVQRMRKKVSSITQDVGVDNATRINKVYMPGNPTERDSEDVIVIVENHFEVDGTKLVDKTTKATIKKINGMQIDSNKAKGK